MRKIYTQSVTLYLVDLRLLSKCSLVCTIYARGRHLIDKWLEVKWIKAKRRHDMMLLFFGPRSVVFFSLRDSVISI